MKIWDWVEEHPYAAGGIIFVVGVIALWLFWPRRQVAADTGSGALQSYYAAQAASTASGDQVAIAQSAYASQTQIALYGAQAAIAAATAQQNVAGIQARAAENIAGYQAQTAQYDIASQQVATNNAILKPYGVWASAFVSPAQVASGGGYGGAPLASRVSYQPVPIPTIH